MAREWTPSPIGFVAPSSSNPERVRARRLPWLAIRAAPRKNDSCAMPLQAPLAGAHPVELADGTAYLMLLNPTGGVVGGDFLSTQIIQEADTRVCLTTPSATRVYRTLAQTRRAGNSDSAWEKALHSNIFPITSFPIGIRNCGNRCASRWARGSRAIFWDAWRRAAWLMASGGISMKSIPACRFLLRGRAVFLNRTRIRPASLDPERLGFAEGFNYHGNACDRGRWIGRWKETVAAMDAELRKSANLRRRQRAGERWMRRQITGALGFGLDARAGHAVGARAPDRPRIAGVDLRKY